MLNTELVDRMYAELPKERQQELITLLFKNSKQTMNYFKRTKDISLSKLEILADLSHAIRLLQVKQLVLRPQRLRKQ